MSPQCVYSVGTGIKKSQGKIKFFQVQGKVGIMQKSQGRSPGQGKPQFLSKWKIREFCFQVATRFCEDDEYIFIRKIKLLSISSYAFKCRVFGQWFSLWMPWVPEFSFGHCYQSVVERGLVFQTLFSSLGKLKSLLVAQCQHYWTSNPSFLAGEAFVRRKGGGLH